MDLQKYFLLLFETFALTLCATLLPSILLYKNFAMPRRNRSMPHHDTFNRFDVFVVIGRVLASLYCLKSVSKVMKPAQSGARGA